jgi:2-methylisocitrate lyase-like PEP mutase family enzyme
MRKFETIRAGFKDRIDRGELTVAPGAYDAMSARAIEAAGWEAVYMSGHGVSAGMIAYTDVGLLTMSEMVQTAHNMAQAISVPLIADMDTGYGNAVNVTRAIREFEQAGAAAVQLEDQAMPKKCGFMKGKALVSKDEMVGKIRAAVAAREDPNFLIVARCDARAVEGAQAMYARLEAYAEAGADLLYAEAPEDANDIRNDATKVIGAPTYLIGLWLTQRYGMTFKDIADLGYAVLIMPELSYTIAPQAVYAAAKEMREKGSYPDFIAEGRQMTWENFQDLIRLPEVSRIEEAYLPDEVKEQRWGTTDLPGEEDYYIDVMR